MRPAGQTGERYAHNGGAARGHGGEGEAERVTKKGEADAGGVPLRHLPPHSHRPRWH